MKSISLSINPCYLCNFSCEFCYLSENQLKDPKLLSLETLVHRLNEIAGLFSICQFDLYGGEITKLPSRYLSELLSVLKTYCNQPVSVITNLSDDLETKAPRLLGRDIDLTVSWDYTARERWEEVAGYMKALRVPFHVLTLASPGFLSLKEDELSQYLGFLHSFPMIETLEIKPYSPSKARKGFVFEKSSNYGEYEKLIKTLLQKNMNFEFINRTKIIASLAGKNNAWSDDHLYITPSGNFSVLEFDSENREFFMPLNSIEEYNQWTDHEKTRTNANQVCSNCEFLGHCLSEHLQEVGLLDQSCNGFKGLLSWARHSFAI